MKTNFFVLALTLALVSSASRAAFPSGSRVSFVFPPEVAGVEEGYLYTPADPALALEERKALAICPEVHPSLAGELCEVKGEDPTGRRRRMRVTRVLSVELADSGTAIKPAEGKIHLAAMAPLLLLAKRRRHL